MVEVGELLLALLISIMMEREKKKGKTNRKGDF